MTKFIFRLGGHIAIFLEAYAGDPMEVTAITAKIRRLNYDRSDYLESAPSIPMTVAFQAASTGQPAGWHVILEATPSPQFASGFYGVDAWIDINATDITTEMVVVHLRKAAGP